MGNKIDGYTIRGVQKVIKENGTKQLLSSESQNKFFTESKKETNEHSKPGNIAQHSISETKRKKLMNVLEGLVQLRKKIDTDL